MANIAELNIRLGVRFRDFDRSMRQVENRLKQTAQSMDGIANSMAQSFTAPFLAIGALAIKAAGDFEALKLAMQTTMKDAGYSAIETTKELEELRKVALAPGIDLQQAVKGSIALQSVGFNAERARKTLVELANGIAGAGGNAEQLEGVTRQFAQMSAKGVVLQQDLAIIKENMPSVVKAMREAFGTTTAEGIRDAGISADQFIDGITQQLAKNARVQGGIKNAIDNTRSAITQFFAAIGDGINEAYNLNAVAGAMSDKINDLVTVFKMLDPETKKSIFNFALYAAAFPILIKSMALLFGAGQQVIAMTRLLSSGAASAGGALLGFADKFGKLNTAMKVGAAGVALVGILALYAGYQKLSDGVNKAFEAQTKFAKAKDEVNKEAGKEIAIANKNIEALKSETTSREEKIKAFNALKESYPDLLKQYDNEKISVSQLTMLQDRLTKSIINRVAETRKSALLDEQAGKIVEARLKKTQLEAQGLNAIYGETQAGFLRGAEGMGLGGWMGTEASIVGEEMAKLDKVIMQAEKTSKSLEEQFAKTFGTGTSAAEETAANLYALRDAEVDYSELNSKFAENWKKREAGKSQATTKSGKSISAIFKEVSKDLDDINKKAAALGATGGEDHFDDFAKGIESGISKLVEAGAKVDGKEITALKQLAREGLGAKLVAPDLLPTAATAQSVGTRSAAIPDVRIAYDKDALNEFLSDSQKIGQVLEQMKSGFISASEGFDAINAILATTNENFTGTGLKMQEMSFAFQALGEQFQMLGQSFQAGGDAQKAIFDAVGASIADLTNEGSVNMKDFAKAAVLSSIKVAKAYAVQGIFAAVSKALQSVPFPINLIAAAGAAGVASALLNGLANKISAPKLAKGGLAYGETLAMVGDNPNASVDPEVIAPLSKLKDIIGGGASDIMVGGTFRIRGEDLELVLQKAKTTKQRRYGNG
jgi:tape measure domain-containing protein